jgi:two-component system CheB/CheR fusion protein
MPRKRALKPRTTPAKPTKLPVDQSAKKAVRDPEQAEAPAKQYCPVAGFGASAGGLEAFTEFLHHLPDDPGLAIVFIQHLDPKHASVLTELLSRSTRMPVSQVTDGMHVAPNRVYVIPPNTNISIEKGVLKLQPRPAGAPHMPIDHFFRSLAEDEGGKAVGVVLSGTASDGTLGLKAIKAEGGITFAQAPESAKYDGMPRSAIAAGCVDFVLPPDAMAGELVRLCQHPYLLRPRPAEALPESERDFNEIFTMLRSATGVDFTFYKPGTIRRRMLRRMALQKLETPEQYVQYLRENRQELDLLFQDILINVTGFFREPAAFGLIKSHVLPSIFKGRSPDEAVRVWVPGCATGEEAYSVAICVMEYIREARLEVPVQIFGTDLSDSALEKARAGVYPESIAADVSPERLRRFFVRVNGTYQIARFVRDICVFARQNVTKDPPFSKLDLITCRNVLIYLGPVLQGKVMRLFHYALKPGGFLVLGASESLGNANELFAPIDKQHKIYSRKPAPTTITTDFGAYEEHEIHGPDRKLPDLSTAIDNQRRVDQMILARYSPPAVVVDRDLKVSQFRGQTSQYLVHPPGEASLNLMKLTPNKLGLEIRKLVHKAEVKGSPAKSDVISVSNGNEARDVRMSVTPIHGLPKMEYLVVFEEAPAGKASPRSKAAPVSKSSPAGERIRELEQELTSTRQYLQSVIEEQEASTEELKSAHEEVQSSNEELQSTNEELLTAKEELQSTNEELTTVNEEMQSRNVELHQVNNDLLNLLSSVNIPIVMLGNDLRIRRFTPHAEKILNLIPADAGRPVSDFRLKINVPDLVALCQEVIDTLAAREREVQDNEGRSHTMWVRPYRTSDNRIDGVVLALFDITERKQSAEARYRRLFEASKDGIVIADAVTGEIVDLNPFVTKLLGYPRSRLIGTKFWESELFNGSEIDESIRAELHHHESVQKTLMLRAESGEHIEVEIVASLYTEADRHVIQFNIRDLSARRRLEERLQKNEEHSLQAHKLEAVGRLAGGLAHNFNNFLTAVLGYTDLLESELSNNHKGRAALEQIRLGAERAVALTKQLMTFGRKQIARPEVLDLNEAVTEQRQVISVMLRENVNLVVDLHPDTPRVRADRTQLEQILLNLVLNAADSMPSGGKITLGTANADVDHRFSHDHPIVPPGRYAAITVKDTGAGMNEETQAHLFEPFFATNPKDAGAGLRLSTTYNLVKQSGGYIWAYSELGLGSTFTVYLPRVEAEEASPDNQPSRTGEDLRGTETVLVAEDEPAVKTLVRRFLELHGYRVLEASSGPEALRIARQHDGQIQLTVADVVMPQMSGRELAFQLAAERPDMKVLYISGETDDEIVHHGVLQDPASFLRKPFTQQALLAKVRGILDSGKEASSQ